MVEAFSDRPEAAAPRWRPPETPRGRVIGPSLIIFGEVDSWVWGANVTDTSESLTQARREGLLSWTCGPKNRSLSPIPQTMVEMDKQRCPERRGLLMFLAMGDLRLGVRRWAVDTMRTERHVDSRVSRSRKREMERDRLVCYKS